MKEDVIGGVCLAWAVWTILSVFGSMAVSGNHDCGIDRPIKYILYTSLFCEIGRAP